MKDKHKQYLFMILMIFWTAFIWHNSLAPRVESNAQSGQVLAIINNILEHLNHLHVSEFLVRKAAHMFEFFVLAILWLSIFFLQNRRCTKKEILLAFLCTAIVAMIDETIQLHVPGRSGEVRDVLVDCTGAAIGLLIFRGGYHLMKRRVGA